MPISYRSGHEKYQVGNTVKNRFGVQVAFEWLLDSLIKWEQDGCALCKTFDTKGFVILDTHKDDDKSDLIFCFYDFLVTYFIYKKTAFVRKISITW